MWELWAWDDSNPGQLMTLVTGYWTAASALCIGRDWLQLYDEVIIVDPLGNVETVTKELV